MPEASHRPLDATRPAGAERPAPPDASSLGPQILMLAMIAIWGASFAAIKIALDAEVPEFVLIAWRFWLAVVCLWPILPRAQRRNSLAISWRPGAITGSALLAGYCFQTFGMQETTSSVGGFMTGLIVLLVAVGARVWFGERLSSPKRLGLGLGGIGLVVLCLGAMGNETGHNTMRGILLQVGSSCCYAGHVLLISRTSPRGHELAFCWWQLLVVALGATSIAAAQGTLGPVERYAADGAVWAAVCYLGLFATALGIGVQSRMQPRIPPTQVAVLFATQPAFAAIAGALLLGDRLSPLEWVGGGLIALGVLVASRRVDAGA